MDNLGYGELGVYGGGILRGAATPRIDTLASEGMVLLNFNVEAQCTPSRSALMTGRFSIRSGTYEVPIGGVPDGLTQWEITIAQLLSAQGYTTGMWGKRKGVTFGRKRKLDKEMVRVAAERYAKGETMAELAEVYGVSEPTIWRALNPFVAGASV
jgi:arylsulfatase A-like enzyme